MSEIKTIISSIQRVDQALIVLYSAADEFVKIIENNKNPLLSKDAKLSINELKVLLENWFRVETDIEIFKVSTDKLWAQIGLVDSVLHSSCPPDDSSGGSYNNFRLALSNAFALRRPNIAEDYSVAIELFNVILNRSDVFRKLDGE